MSLPFRPTSAQLFRRHADLVELYLRNAEVIELAHGIGL
jgi:hypothetical protein